MSKRLHLFALASVLLLSGGVASAQYPIMNRIADKVIQKYQNSTCQQLMMSKAEKQPPSPGEQKAMEMLKTDPAMRHEFVGIVADPVVDKLIQCGMIP